MTDRLLPDVPLPPYTFVPGKAPHPFSNSAGHSFGIAPPMPPPVTADNWVTHRTYLRGLDLFNAGFWWESHVEFEALWLACGRRGTDAEFLKGLIQLAAAGVKHLEGIPAGVRAHAVRAGDLFRQVAATAHTLFGLRLSELIDLANAVGSSGWPRTAPRLEPIGFSHGA